MAEKVTTGTAVPADHIIVPDYDRRVGKLSFPVTCDQIREFQTNNTMIKYHLRGCEADEDGEKEANTEDKGNSNDEEKAAHTFFYR